MPADAAQLIIRQPGQPDQSWPLTTDRLRIGREALTGLALSHPQVSRQHAELRREPQGWTLTDLNSANGTFHNGARLPADQPVLLRPGDTIRIGPFTLVFEMRVGTPVAPPAPAPPPPPAQGPAAAASPAAPAAAPTPPPPTRGGAPTNLLPDRGGPLPVPPAPRPPEEFVITTPVSRYLDNLPVIFQDDVFLGRYLRIFEAIWEPLEQRQDHLDLYIDPFTCPAEFLPWLASWMGLPLNPRWPEIRRRRLLSRARELYHWRGTREGLANVIRLVTGLTAEITDGLDQPFVFRVRLRIPPGSDVTREFIEELIQAHKPAHAGYVLEVLS